MQAPSPAPCFSSKALRLSRRPGLAGFSAGRRRRPALFDFHRSSDETYLEKFNFFESPNNYLISNLNTEGFWDRDYFTANAYSFQELRPDPRPETPFIPADLDYRAIGDPDEFGGRWELDSNFRVLTREDYADSQRV